MGAIQRLVLHHPTGQTPVFVGHGALRVAADRLAEWVADRSLFVVTTPRVLSLHGNSLADLRQAAARTLILEVAEGEEAKSLETAAELWRRMLALGGKRDSRLVAFGGGSVGDLGGFVAGCFLRGIELVQMPTTLLAQVDAAVGGKTAVDLPAAKNAVGLFNHPEAVVSDTAFLSTLPGEELRSGLAEVVKMAVLLDSRLFARVEESLPRLLEGDAEALAPVVVGAVAAKIRVVEADPREADLRRLLNFGHTLGHALEAAAGYRGLRHGEAVAYGMLFALRLAEARGLDAAVAERLRRLLRYFGLPPVPPVAREGLVDAMLRDKKARESGLVWVLPVALGKGEVVTGITSDEVIQELGPFLAEPFAGLTVQ